MEAVLFRVYTPGQPAFRLRPGEEGLSVFDPDLVYPPLTEAEVLESFRPGSGVWRVSVTKIGAQGLVLVRTPGAGMLPVRLRTAHAEIRPGVDMSRRQFKRALEELSR